MVQQYTDKLRQDFAAAEGQYLWETTDPEYELHSAQNMLFEKLKNTNTVSRLTFEELNLFNNNQLGQEFQGWSADYDPVNEQITHLISPEGISKTLEEWEAYEPEQPAQPDLFNSLSQYKTADNKYDIQDIYDSGQFSDQQLTDIFGLSSGDIATLKKDINDPVYQGQIYKNLWAQYQSNPDVFGGKKPYEVLNEYILYQNSGPITQKMMDIQQTYIQNIEPTISAIKEQIKLQGIETPEQPQYEKGTWGWIGQKAQDLYNLYVRPIVQSIDTAITLTPEQKIERWGGMEQIDTWFTQYAPDFYSTTSLPEDGLANLRNAAIEFPEEVVDWAKGMVGDTKTEEIARKLLNLAIPELSASDIEDILGTALSVQTKERIEATLAEHPEVFLSGQIASGLDWIMLNPDTFIDRLTDAVGDDVPYWAAGLLSDVYGIRNTEAYQYLEQYKDDKRSFWGKVSDSLALGTGDMFKSLGGGIKWAEDLVGLDTFAGGMFGGIGEEIAKTGEVQHQNIENIEGMGWEVIRMLPTQVALIGASLATGGVAAGVAGATGVTGGIISVGSKIPVISRLVPYTNSIIEATASGVASRSLESLMEAGGTYNDLLAQGYSQEEASKIAGEIFTRNLQLSAIDVGQFATVFYPQLTKPLDTLFSKNLITKIAGKAFTLGGVMLSEAGEEYYQQIIQMQAMGEDVSAWAIAHNLSNEEIRQVTILGAIAGGLFAGGGAVLNAVNNITLNNLPSDIAGGVRNRIAQLVKDGFSASDATVQSLNELGDRLDTGMVQNAVKVADIQQQVLQIKPADAAIAMQIQNKLNADISALGLQGVQPVRIVSVPSQSLQVQTTAKMELGAEEFAQYKAKGQEPNIVVNNAEEFINILEASKQENGGLTRGLDAYTVPLNSLSDSDLIKVLNWSREQSTYIHRFFGGKVADVIESRGGTVPQYGQPVIDTTQTGEGVQADIFGGQTRQRFEGKGEVTQMGMDDYAKYKQAMKQAKEPPAMVDSVIDKQQELTDIEYELQARNSPFHAKMKNLFPNTTSAELAEKADKLRQEIRDEMANTPLEALPEPTYQELKEDSKLPQRPRMSLEAAIELSGFFGDYIMSGDVVSAYELQRQLQKQTRSERFRAFQQRIEELHLGTPDNPGLPIEEAAKQARKETLSGELPSVSSDFFDAMTADLRDALFTVVYHNEQLQKFPAEMLSTMTALTNALTGKPIPMKRGTGSALFPDGGSAFDRLNLVFGEQPKVLQAIDKMSKDEVPLNDVVEMVYERGAYRSPKELFPDIKNVMTYPGEKLSFQEYGVKQTELIPEGIFEDIRTEGLLEDRPYNPPSISDTRTPAQQTFSATKLDLDIQLSQGKINQTQHDILLARARDKAYPVPPVTRFDPAIESAFKDIENGRTPKQGAMLTTPEKNMIVKILKETGMTAVDIGNFLRANKASLDMSFWRQIAPLATGHPANFYRANVEAFKALFSRNAAEANWQWITHDPDYELYEAIRQDTQADPLRPRHPRKGGKQYEGTEEFGYLTGNRPLPKLAKKIPWIRYSQRSFESGTNTMVWLCWKDYLADARMRSDNIASGKVTLKEGEAFDIRQEMQGFQKMLADMVQRGSMGKATEISPVISAFVFAPRATVGKILTPRHLFATNPRVRLEAWRNLGSFVTVIGGVVALGSFLDLWDIEEDPRSADFMTIRIGNTRIDPWAGHKQMVNFYSRLITQSGISSITGAEYDANVWDTFSNFVRGKSSPGFQLIMDFWTGENYFGEKVSLSDAKQWIERLAPFMIWDVYEASQEGAKNALIAALPGFFGAGVQTYSGDWNDSWNQLGTTKYTDNLGYGLTEPYYDLGDVWADNVGDFRDVDPSTLTKDRGYPEWVQFMAETRQLKDTVDQIPAGNLASLNADPWKNDGKTFVTYYQMWKEYQKADDKEQWIKDNPLYSDYYLGNMTQKEYALLTQYHSLPEDEQADFLEKHPELTISRKDDYLRAHPQENAALAFWGQYKILTQEAYTEYQKLIAKYGIPESGIVPGMAPPENIATDYFAYQDLLKDFEAGSSESTYFKLTHDDFFEWGQGEYGWQDIKLPEGMTEETYTDFLKIKLDNKDMQAQYDDIESDDDRRQFLIDNDAFHQAIFEMDYLHDAVPEEYKDMYMQYRNDAFTYGGSSAETKLLRLQNPDFNEWGMSEDGMGWATIDSGKMATQDYIKYLELNVKYREEEDIYNGITGQTTAQLDAEREAYLIENPEYAKARLQMDGYQKGIPGGLIDTWVEWQETGFTKGSILGKAWLMNHPDFFNTVRDILGWTSIMEDPAYLKIKSDFATQFTEFENLKVTAQTEDELDQLRSDYFANNPAFETAFYQAEGYENDIPTEWIDTYSDWRKTGYTKGTTVGDRWLSEHMDFFEAVRGEMDWGPLVDTAGNPYDPGTDEFGWYNDAYSYDIPSDQIGMYIDWKATGFSLSSSQGKNWMFENWDFYNAVKDAMGWSDLEYHPPNPHEYGTDEYGWYEDAYSKGISDDWVDTYIEWKNTRLRKGSIEGDAWLWDHKDFFDAVQDAMGWAELDTHDGSSGGGGSGGDSRPTNPYDPGTYEYDAWRFDIPDEWWDTYIAWRESGYTKGTIQGDRWLQNHPGFAEAVADLLGWSSPVSTGVGYSAGGGLAGATYVPGG